VQRTRFRKPFWLRSSWRARRVAGLSSEKDALASRCERLQAELERERAGREQVKQQLQALEAKHGAAGGGGEPPAVISSGARRGGRARGGGRSWGLYKELEDELPGAPRGGPECTQFSCSLTSKRRSGCWGRLSRAREGCGGGSGGGGEGQAGRGGGGGAEGALRGLQAQVDALRAQEKMLRDQIEGSWRACGGSWDRTRGS